MTVGRSSQRERISTATMPERRREDRDGCDEGSHQ
jgi:hypothetical protein